MFAALEFSVAMSGAGVQPIIGCQVDVTYLETRPGDVQTAPARMVLLAQNEVGYENLMKLNTCLYVGNDGQLPQVSVDDLAYVAAGIICLTGGPEGPIGNAARRSAPCGQRR